MAAKKGEKGEDDDGDEAVEEDISFVLITSCVKATLHGMAWHEAKRSEAKRWRSNFFSCLRKVRSFLIFFTLLYFLDLFCFLIV